MIDRKVNVPADVILKNGTGGHLDVKRGFSGYTHFRKGRFPHYPHRLTTKARVPIKCFLATGKKGSGQVRFKLTLSTILTTDNRS